jgi:hypothetical protein
MSEYHKLHKQIIRDYIMEFQTIYTTPIKTTTTNLDPYKLLIDQYFTGVDDNVWLKLENRPKVNKLVEKKIGEMMIEIVLETPSSSLYSIRRDDEICQKFNVDLRIGTHHFIIVKYNLKEISTTVKKNIINTFVNLKKHYPTCQTSVGLIEDSYGSKIFNEEYKIYQLSGDTLLKLIMPYEHPSYEINMLLKDELAYCFNSRINSRLHFEAIEKLSSVGQQDIPVIPPSTANAIEKYKKNKYDRSKTNTTNKDDETCKPKRVTNKDNEMCKPERVTKKAQNKTAETKKGSTKSKQQTVSKIISSESESKESSNESESDTELVVPSRFNPKIQQKSQPKKGAKNKIIKLK